VDVKRYLDRQGSNASPSNNYHYYYYLWVPQYKRFQATSQSFTKYPTPEYNWNNVDELICGYFDELRPATKYRRKLYAIVPEEFLSEEEVESYIGRMDKLFEYFNSRRSKEGEVLEVEVVKRFYPSSLQGRRLYAREVMGNAQGPRKTSYINIPLGHPHTPPASGTSTSSTGPGTNATANANGPSGLTSLNTTLSTQLSAHSITTSTTTSTTTATTASSRYEWINVMCDAQLDPYSVYHIEIHWLVCSARNVREFVQSLYRKCQQLNLNIITIPEYSRSNDLQVHPFIAHPFICLPPVAIVHELVEESLVVRLDFVADDERPTNWKEMGVVDDCDVIPHLSAAESALTTSLSWIDR